MMDVCLRGNGETKLGQIRGGDRSVFLADTVGTGTTVEGCVHGASVSLLES